jgi:transcriptional regulator with XRE-family HTH domain
MARQKKRSQHASIAPSGAAEEVNQDMEVGTRLRHQRLTKRMTLRELAGRADCSESMLSKVENGRALPSLTTLHRVCAVLGLTVGQLFKKTNAPPGIVCRAAERPVLNMHPLRPNSKLRIEQLVPVDPRNLLEGSIHVFSPNSGFDLLTHEGEEVCYVIEGTIEATVGGETYTVHEGDSLHFRSEFPHGYRNPGRKVARMIVINTPPTF